MTRRLAKRRWVFRRLAAVALACGLVTIASPASTQSSAGNRSNQVESDSVERADLLALLQAGGTVIVIRHAATDRSKPDHSLVDLDDCATQRNLTEEGRAEAKAIGAAFRELRIPVGIRWTSPYCRARETAQLAFGQAETIDGLERLYPERDQAADRRISRLILEQAPVLGAANMVITGHGVYPGVLQPAVALREGEAAIYSVRGNKVALLGQVAPDEWAGLSAGAGTGADDLSEIAERVLRSVVAVEPKSQARGSAGSGFRIAVPRMVVTSAHVVGEAEDVVVVLADGTRRAARVLGRSIDFDIAVVEVDDSNLPAMHSGSGLTELRQGDHVLAIGAMAGHPGAVAPGSILSLSRRVQLPAGGDLELLQVDANITPGHRGGPLVNAEGLVVGVNTMIAPVSNGGQATGSAYAIPVDIAKRVALAIIANR